MVDRVEIVQQASSPASRIRLQSTYLFKVQHIEDRLQNGIVAATKHRSSVYRKLHAPPQVGDRPSPKSFGQQPYLTVSKLCPGWQTRRRFSLDLFEHATFDVRNGWLREHLPNVMTKVIKMVLVDVGLGNVEVGTNQENEE